MLFRKNKKDTIDEIDARLLQLGIATQATINNKRAQEKREMLGAGGGKGA